MRTSKFVVTGCSRSGTGYISKLLSEIGYKCGHESIFNYYYLRNLERPTNFFEDFPDFDGDSSSGAAPFLHELPFGTVVLHQVRHPVNCIRSHMGIHSFTEHNSVSTSPYLADDHVAQVEFFDKRYCPEIFLRTDESTRCMVYWLMWNRLTQKGEKIEGLHYFRYRVESLDLCMLRQIVNMLGGSAQNLSDEELKNALSSVSRSVNSRLRDDSISWETLPEGPEKRALEQCAIEYGYTL